MYRNLSASSRCHPFKKIYRNNCVNRNSVAGPSRVCVGTFGVTIPNLIRPSAGLPIPLTTPTRAITLPLSSRPQRSAVEGSAVPAQTWTQSTGYEPAAFTLLSALVVGGIYFGSRRPWHPVRPLPPKNLRQLPRNDAHGASERAAIDGLLPGEFTHAASGVHYRLFFAMAAPG